jgi:hypothetical protein
MKYSTKIIYIFISGNILLANCKPSPQGGEVTIDDILEAAGDNTRYGENQGDIDPNLLNDVFGGNNNPNEDLVANQDYIYDDPNVGNPGVEEDSEFDKCEYYEQHEDDYGYECVPYYNCKNGTIITDGGGLFDIRGNFLDPLTSKCESYLEVCCRHEDYEFDAVPTRPPPRTTEPPITRQPTTLAPFPNNPNNNNNNNNNQCPGRNCPYAPYRQRCGRHNPGGIGVRIQNLDRFSGSTQFGEWPHMCAILNKSQVGGREVNLYVGGASLIAPGVVLTGAHVVNDIVDYSNVKVRCGEWDTQQQIEPEKHVDKRAKYISVHPAFDSKNLENDFALIHLEEDFQLTQHINTMCLPDPVFEDDSYDTTNCFATGWGKDKFGSDGEYQVILKQVQMDIADHDECEDKFQKSRLGRRFELDDSFLCAGGEPGKDTCKGDGGGPLVCPSKTNIGQYEQAGIVAWGLGCGSETPGVYADVTKALRFIDWATKCVDGPDADYYGFGFGDRWAKRDYCQFKEDITDNERNLDEERRRLSRAQSKSEKRAIRSNVRSYNKQLKKQRKLLPLYENAILNCSSGKKDFDCRVYDYGFDEYDDRDVDLSDFSRDSTKEGEENIPKAGPRLGNIDK